MSLIVEDGTVVPSANSYTSIAYASNYHGSVGNFAWAAIPTEASSPPPGTMTQDALLQKATQYMVGVYRLRWSGLRVQPDATQNLWPDLDQRTLVEKVGEIQVNYDRFSPQFRRFRQIDLMLNPYLDGTN